MNKKQCLKSKDWHLKLNITGKHNVCSNCEDYETCKGELIDVKEFDLMI